MANIDLTGANYSYFCKEIKPREVSQSNKIANSLYFKLLTNEQTR
jgi:hypothetical protein